MQMYQYSGPSGAPQPSVSPEPPPQGAQQERYNVWAIVALVSVFFLPILPLIFAIIALVQIKNNPGQKGRWMAITAIVLEVVGLVLFALAIIGAVMYFSVLQPAPLLPQKCEFSAGFDCTEAPSAKASSGTITFPIVNSLGYHVRIDSVSSSGDAACTGAGATVNGVALPTMLANGMAGVIVLDGCTLNEAERYNEPVTFVYTSNATGMPHSLTGTVAGTVRS